MATKPMRVRTDTLMRRIFKASALDELLRQNEASLGQESFTECLDALCQGKLNCVVECNPDTGPELIHLVKTLLNQNTVPKETYIEESVFTENDSLKDLKPRGY